METTIVDCYKLNIDGSAIDNPGKARVRAFIDHTGSWVIGAYRRIPRAIAIEVELWALRNGLLSTSDSNITNLEIKVVATIIIQFMYVVKVFNIILSPLIDECWMLFHSMNFKSLKHVFWKRNKCADEPARLRSNYQLSSSQNDYLPIQSLFCLRRTPPSYLNSLLGMYFVLNSTLISF